METEQLKTIVKQLVAEGNDPNKLCDIVEEAILETGDWALWGDGRYRKDMVCSKCGSSYAGICADKPHPKITDTKNPLFHKNQLGVVLITAKEWKKQSGK